MTINDFLSRFDKPKKTANGWEVRCPGHDDKNASLSITEGQDGRILLHCHAGCSTESVVAAMGLKMSDLFPVKTETIRTPPPVKKKGKLHDNVDAAVHAAGWAIVQRTGTEHREVGRWPYHNANGEVMAFVVRFDPVDAVPDENGKIDKTFAPIHRDGAGWRVGDPPGLWPLFNLPEILKSSGPVFVNEGEGKSEAGKGIGLTCTTSAHGAKSPNKTDWKPLAGHDVFILPDNDAAGEAYGQTVAEILSKLDPPARVKIVELPGLPPKGDLLDFCESHDATEPATLCAEIMHLAEAAPVWTPHKNKSASDNDQIIVLPGGSVSITKCAEIIFQRLSPDHELFIRGGVVMELRQDDAGGLRLDVMRAQAFRSRIEKLGLLVVWRSGAEGQPVLKPTTCPADTAEALLASEPAANLLPKVRGLVACPVLAEIDGHPRVLAKGYHSVNGGLLVTAGDTPPKMEVDQAVEALHLLVADFDFASPGDRSRALASFITPALRLGGWLRGHIPIDIAEADQSQSGKTYRQKLVFALYSEEPYRIALRDGGVGGLDESIAQALIAGRPFIQVDNVRGRIESQFIEMMTTAGGCIGARVPHRGEVQVDSRHFLLMMTSNGVETTRDMANRASIIRIRKRPGCAFREFPEGDLLVHVHANQAFFLGAVFAVIGAWSKAGKPRTDEKRHDFREWAQVLDWIVQHVLKEAPLIDGHTAAQERVSNPALTWLRQVALAIEADHRLDEDIMAGSIGELCEDHNIDIPGLRDGADETGRNKRVGILMKKAFGEVEEIEIDRYRVKRTEKDHYYEADQQYKKLRAYVFNLQKPEQPELPEQPPELSKKPPCFSESIEPYSGYSGSPAVEDEERAAIMAEGSLNL